jgi:hypothetical protein
MNVLKFIKKYESADDLFRRGQCFWFAFILAHRFKGTIMYQPVDNHFVAKIKNKYYDVTGEVKGDFQTIDEARKDPLHWERIKRDCIL